MTYEETDVMNVGDRVRDKYKQPRPGDDCICGVVVDVVARLVTIVMDDGQRRGPITVEMAGKLFEVIDV